MSAFILFYFKTSLIQLPVLSKKPKHVRKITTQCDYSHLRHVWSEPSLPVNVVRPVSDAGVPTALIRSLL